MLVMLNELEEEQSLWKWGQVGMHMSPLVTAVHSQTCSSEGQQDRLILSLQRVCLFLI